MSQATFRIWRGDAQGGDVQGLRHRSRRGHGRARRRAPHPGRAGQRPGRALELQGRQMRLVLGRDQRQPAPDVHDAPGRRSRSTSPVTIQPMHAFPLIKDLVTDVSWNYRGQEEDQEVQAAQARRAGRHVAHAAGRRRPRAGVPKVHRVLPVPGRVSRAARPRQARRVHRPALLRLRGGARDAPARHRGPPAGPERTRRASATATSPSAAPRSAPSASPSPTTRSSRSRSAWSIASTIR